MKDIVMMVASHRLAVQLLLTEFFMGQLSRDGEGWGRAREDRPAWL